MEKKPLDNIETRIMEAANKVFLKYGAEAATMLQIADAAGISRTSLHYYFRSKSHLFETVLERVEAEMIPALSEIIESDSTLLQKIETFIDKYIDLIVKYPMVPGFLFSEIQRNPGWIVDFLKKRPIDVERLKGQIDREITEGKIRDFKLEDLLANMIGMCVFPILSKPVFETFFFDGNEDKFFQFMNLRKKEIMRMMSIWLARD